MAQAHYPYLDLTVLPQIRAHVVAPYAAVLFDPQFEEVLWSNGEGATLIGAERIRDLLDSPLELDPVMRRQIAAAEEQAEQKSEARGTLRLRRGFKSRLVGFSLSTIGLPGGGSAVLMRTDPLHGRSHSKEDMARSAVDSLDGYSHASAIIDANGKIISSSEHFNTLQVPDEELQALTQEVRNEDDRLVKRPIKTGSGAMPAGIARLADDPALHLLIIADAQEDISIAARTAVETSDKVVSAVLSPKSPNDEENGEADGEERRGFGLFSNKRSGGGPGRWWYKSRNGSKPAQKAAQDAPSEPAEEIRDDSPVSAGKAADVVVSGSRSSTGTVSVVVNKASSDASGKPETGAQEEDAVAALLSDEPAPADMVDDAEDGFRFAAGAQPVRFVWEMDTENRFRSVSPEFARTVGTQSADVIGKVWSEVAEARGLANAGEISKLLDKGDTWSGKTVLWPVEGTDLRVPIDLAGLPTFGRNRTFEGFNGFGIIRTADAVVDDQASDPPFEVDHSSSDKLTEENRKTPVGFIPSARSKSDETQISETNGSKEKRGELVDLSARRNSKSERALSDDEKETFQEIGDKLGEPVSKRGKPAGAQEEPVKSFVPSAFARTPSKARGESARTSDDRTSGRIKTPHHEVDTSILARLPIPVLVYRDDELLFGNSEFFKLTGYQDLQDLAQSGGVDALFGAEKQSGEETQARIFHKKGMRLDVEAHIQRVPWDERRAMLLTLRNRDEETETDSGSPQSASVDGESDSKKPATEGKADKSADQRAEDGKPARSASVTPLRAVKSSTEKTGSDKQQAFGGLGASDLRNILDVATDGVIILSDEGIVRALNKSAEALFDVASEDVTEQSITRLLAPESHRLALDYVSGLSGTGVASVLNDGREVIGRTTQGGLIPLFMTIGKLDKTDACCAVVRDITQFKKTEEELVTAKSQAEAANAQKTQFLATISHEIRTPLNAIIGFSDLMIEERFGKIDNDRYRGYLRDIHRSGNHVLELINDLLDISKIESGNMELEFDACNLNAIVSETVALNQPDANKERVIIRTSLSAVVPKVVADPRSLRQIILNLVSNGIKYTRSGGQVIVSTVYEESGEVVLRVRDTGIGMSEAELATALRPFQQVSGTKETGQQGTGLGLPLTKAMVEANRAQFHIESKPEEGTLVEIHFPVQRVLADR